MARKRAPQVPATKTAPVQEVKTADVTIESSAARRADVPMRFMMPRPEYDELSRQARKLGLSNASYAKMLVMKGVAAEEGGAK